MLYQDLFKNNNDINALRLQFLFNVIKKNRAFKRQTMGITAKAIDSFTESARKLFQNSLSYGVLW